MFSHNPTVIPTLLWLDMKSLRNWWREAFWSKLFVLIAFGLVSLAVAGAIGGGMYGFALAVKPYDIFGFLTTHYVVQAGLVLVLWLATISSMVATVSSLLKPNQDFLTLLQSPISRRDLVLWQWLRTLVGTTALFGLLFVPATLGYGYAFGLLDTPYVFGTLVLTISYAVITHAVGSGLAYIVAPILRGRVELAKWLAGFAFVIVTVALVELIFPYSLRQLLVAPPEEFLFLYNQLPLNERFIRIFVGSTFFTTSELLRVLPPLGLAATLALFFSWFEHTNLAREYQHLLAQNSQPVRRSIVSTWYRYPHLLKEWLAFWRQPNERSFFAFFLGLLGFFFLFLFRSTQINIAALTDMERFGQLTLGSVLFLASAYSLRLIFPLIAREGEASWYSLSNPETRRYLFWSKFFFGIFLSLIFLCFVSLGWLILPIHPEEKLWLALFSTFGILFLNIVAFTFGAFFPNWKQGEHPEEVSTSPMGILALITCLSFVASSMLIYMEKLPLQIAAGTAVTVVGASLLLALSAWKSRTYRLG